MLKMSLRSNFILLYFIFFTVTLFSQNVLPKKLLVIASKKYETTLVPEIKKSYEKACINIEKYLQLPAIEETKIVICSDLGEIKKYTSASIPSWVLGLAFPSRNLVLINASNLGILANKLDSVVIHEVCHLYLGAWERQNQLIFPQWFNEGVCEWISGRLHFDHNDQIFDGVIANKIIPFSSIENGFPSDSEAANMAYLQSRDMIEYLSRIYEKDSIPSIIKNFEKTQDFVTAVESVTFISFATLESNWLSSITPKYKWLWQIAKLFSLFTIMSILVILAYLKQQRKKQRIHQLWEQEEKEFYENTRD